MSFQKAARFVSEQAWAMLPSALLRLQAAVAGDVDALDELKADFEGRMAAFAQREQTSSAIAVLPVYGVIQQRASFFSMLFGGSSTEALGAQLRQLVGDETVKAIVLDFDSPGGTVSGVEELAADLYKLRGRKPIVAVADSMAASAAYWIASSADEIVVSPSAEVGSIGVFSLHIDVSKALEMDGIKPTFIQAGKFKTEGSSFEPLSDEARAYEQSRVDDYYGMFVRAVARGRGVSVEKVRSADFGEGRMVGAKRAVAAGMATSVGTLNETIVRLANARTNGAGAKAEDEPIEIEAAVEDAPVIEQPRADDMELRRRRLRALSGVA